MNEYLIKAAALTYKETIQVPVLDGDGNPTYDENGDPIMEDQVIDVPFYPPGDFRAVVLAGMTGSDYVLDILHTDDPTLPGDSLIGAWDWDGERIAALDDDAYQAIRPLGNYPDGSATRDLVFHHFSGSRQRELGDHAAAAPVARLYPADNMPFPIRISHKYFSGHADPNHDGWGWRAEMDPAFVPTTRDPAAYFVNIYTDPRCRVEDNWYNASSFSKGPSEWFFDEDGEPIETWQVEYDQAYLGQGDKAPVHYGVCKGSIHNQEGHGTLALSDDHHDLLFWENVQPLPPGPGEWADTGATVIGLAGAVIRISDAGVAAGLVAGQQIRFGDDLEATFTGLWPGGADYLEVDPYPTGVQVGDVLWSWQ